MTAHLRSSGARKRNGNGKKKSEQGRVVKNCPAFYFHAVRAQKHPPHFDSAALFFMMWHIVRVGA